MHNNKQAVIILKAAEQLGFTPAARSRVQVQQGPPDDEDAEWAELARLS